MEDRRIYEFGPYLLDPVERILWREKQLVPLTAKVFDILVLLVCHHGHLVGKEELMRSVWPDTFIEENNLTVSISALRKALGESPSGRPYIETVPKRGYRFVADVRESKSQSAPPNDAAEDAAPHSAASQGSGLLAEAAAVPAPPLGSADSLRAQKAPLLKKPWLIGLTALICLIVVAGYYRYSVGPTRPGPEGRQPQSIAVLPFQSVGRESGDDLLGLGLADAIITKLSETRTLIIRPTGSVLGYQNPGKDILAAGRDLQVKLVLDGTVLRSGGQVRISARLLHVADGTTLWTTTFNERWTNIFALQDAVSERLTKSLTRQLTGQEQNLPSIRYSESPQAYQQYLKGLVFWNKRTEDGIRKAIEYFEQAIETDPTYAMAYSGLADSYLTLATYGVLPSAEVYLRAKAAADQALQQDPTLAEPHATLGMVALYHTWDWSGAEREFKRAIELKPDSAIAHQRYALGLMRTGQYDQAIVEIRLAEQFDPLSPTIGANVGQVLYLARRYDEAIEELQKKLKIGSGFWLAHRILGEAYLQKNRSAEAIVELQEALHSGGGPPVLAEIAFAQAVSGNELEARKILAELKSMAKQRYVSPFSLALAYTGLGEKDRAFAYLQQSYTERSRWLITLKIDPMLDSLRDDPRFTQLMQKMGLAP